MEEAQLVDVREPDEIAKASLPEFQVFPLRQFGTWAPEITSKLNLEKDTFVMCKAGGRSLQVANWLQSQGFKSVYVYTVAGTNLFSQGRPFNSYLLKLPIIFSLFLVFL